MKSFALLIFFSMSALTCLAAAKKGTEPVVELRVPAATFKIQENDFLMLDETIAATRSTLQVQEELRQLLQQFMEAQSLLLKNENNLQAATTTLRTAKKLVGMIERHHLEYLVRPELLADLREIVQLMQH